MGLPTHKNGMRIRCEACGAPWDENHHCDPKREASIEQRRSTFTELGRAQPRSFAFRLNEGVQMLRQAR